MTHRVLALSLTFALLVAPLAADTQTLGRVPQVSFLAIGAPRLPYFEAFREGLRELQLGILGDVSSFPNRARREHHTMRGQTVP
jgi:hypothetical protein